MYTAIYIYPVPRDQVAPFLQVQREAAVIYRQYGCAPFPLAFEIEEGEEVFVGLSRFRDLAHHDEVMRQVDGDDRIDQLYRKVSDLLEVGRVVRGEFERVA